MKIGLLTCSIGSLLALCLPARAAFNCVADIPPVAALIQVAAPDAASGKSVVTGSAGAVPPGSTVVLLTLETGNTSSVVAAKDGSFSTSLFAPPGTTVLVKAGPLDPTKFYFDLLGCLPGTFVLAGPPPGGAAGLSVSGAGEVLPFPSQTMWTFQGAIDAKQYDPGAKLHLTGTLTIASAALATAGSMSVQGGIFLERLSGPDGTGALGHNTFASIFTTPTGFPIERFPLYGWTEDQQVFPIAMRDGSHASAAIEFSYTLPSNLLPGYYRPYVAFTSFNGVPNVPATQVSWSPQYTADDSAVAETNGTDRLWPLPSALLLPIIRVGDPAPPRLFWSLLTDELSADGTRGTDAIEDRGHFGTASRIAFQADTFILPRQDPDTGNPIRYRLEPFALTVSVANHIHPPGIPIIPFRFPSGSLTVTIEAPDGSVTTIGPAPFVQGRNRGLISAATENDLNPNGGHIQNAYQLSTMDPRFEVPFTEDGLHRIRLEGSIDDIWGNTWSASGTYEVYIASGLSLDTAVLPGTPFVVGDTFAPGLIVSPPGAASVTVKWQLLPNSDPTKAIQGVVSGQANAFGYFQPSGGGIQFTQPGEYRVDVTATFTDKSGNLWMGSRTWGGVVAPQNPVIVAHGRRGTDEQQEDGTQWFYRTQTGIASNGPDHVQFPFHSGDVMWGQLDDAATPTLTFQDLTGALGALVSSRPTGLPPQEAAIGQAPILISRPDGVDPHLDPSKVDLWAYAYSSVQLPLVRVREEIVGGQTASPYWRFYEQSAHQLGTDADGDRPNNFKFQYGGVVMRGSAVANPAYDIYGSLLILVPVGDVFGGTRVFPPFQGNGGGPSGGPLMTFNGKAIDMFVHLTGIRPGSVLETGDTFVLAGAVAPALPALVSYAVTAPDGSVTQYSGRANKVGYYYRPENDFVVTTPGIYTVDLKVTYDGLTSAGQVASPFPSGDVLGTDGGRFYFYVTPQGSSPLGVNIAPGTMLSTKPLDVPVAAASGHVTAMVPGFELESRAITGAGGTFTYRYAPASFSPDLPIGPNVPGRNFNLVTISLFDPQTNEARVLAFQGLKLVTLDPPAGFPAATHQRRLPQ